MLQNAPGAILIFLLAACGGAQAQSTKAPPAKHAEVAACLDTLMDGAGWGVFAVCTAELHTKPSCQAAWVEGARAQAPFDHVAEIAQSCAAAYCSELSVPRPTLCDTKADGSPIMVVYLAELEAAILSRDAGLHGHPGLLGRFAATLFAVMPMQANDSSVQLTLPTGARGTELSETTLVVSLLNDGTVTLDGNRISEGDLRKRFVAAHAENVDIQVVIKADTTVAHGRVVTAMDTAKSAGISRLAISTRGEPTN